MERWSMFGPRPLVHKSTSDLGSDPTNSGKRHLHIKGLDALGAEDLKGISTYVFFYSINKQQKQTEEGNTRHDSTPSWLFSCKQKAGQVQLRNKVI